MAWAPRKDYIGGPISTETRINERIRVPEVRLIGPGGEQVGIVRIEDALRVAADADLDLVEVAPDAKPPVCKIMDYGKFKYETAQKERESRKNQQQTVVKEQKLRPKIDPHDYETKKGHVVRFLEAGSKVKVTIMFRGREQSRPELGYRLLQRLGADVADYGFVETSAKQDGRNMTMVLAPHRGAKTRAKAAHDATRRLRQRASAAAQRSTDRPTTELEDSMPKAKTHSGASKRFRLTGTGKIVRQKANKRHLLEHKASKRTRRLDGRTTVAANDTSRVKKMLNG